MRYGLQTQIKFGVGSSEVIKIMLRAIVKRKWPAENFQLCADNISVDRLLTKGHMDWVVSLCAEMGIDPIKAIKMATLYTARAFRMDNRIGSLTPGRFADIVLTDSLSKINPRFVFKDGELVAKDRKMLKQADIDYSGMVKKPVPGLGDLTPEQLDIVPLEVSADGTQAKVYLFDVYGRGHEKFFQEVWVPLRAGKVVAEVGGVKLNRISVVQRYANGKRHVVNGLFKGVSIERGAVATFWPAPKAYFVAVGQDSAEMCDCLKQVDACSDCGEAFGHIRADDGPAWLTVMVTGHVIVALMMSVEALLTMPLWASISAFSALSVAMVLGLLQRAKGIFIGLIWQTKASEAVSAAPHLAPAD